MNPVRCASCRKTLAYTDSDGVLRNKIYCNGWCYEEPPATPFEDRNDQWKMLVAAGWSPVAVGKMYGFAHSQVYKTIGRG